MELLQEIAIALAHSTHTATQPARHTVPQPVRFSVRLTTLVIMRRRSFICYSSQWFESRF